MTRNAQSGSGGKHRVLLVEDDPDFTDLVCQGLQALQLEVVPVGDWVQAMDRLLTENFDLAVVDVGLPGVEGDEVVKLIREVAQGQGRKIPVVLFSSLPKDSLARLAFQVRADGYASKVDGLSGLQSTLVRVMNPGGGP